MTEQGPDAVMGRCAVTNIVHEKGAHLNVVQREACERTWRESWSLPDPSPAAASPVDPAPVGTWGTCDKYSLQHEYSNRRAANMVPPEVLDDHICVNFVRCRLDVLLDPSPAAASPVDPAPVGTCATSQKPHNAATCEAHMHAYLSWKRTDPAPTVTAGAEDVVAQVARLAAEFAVVSNMSYAQALEFMRQVDRKTRVSVTADAGPEGGEGLGAVREFVEAEIGSCERIIEMMKGPDHAKLRATAGARKVEAEQILAFINRQATPSESPRSTGGEGT